MEIPLFLGEGDDAQDWVNKAEQYIQERGILEEERLVAARVAIEGRAKSWFFKNSEINLRLMQEH